MIIESAHILSSRPETTAGTEPLRQKPSTPAITPIPSAPPAPEPAVEPTDTTPSSESSTDSTSEKSDTEKRVGRIQNGILDINASPWAEVRIDGRLVGTTPILGLKLPAGRHQVTFSNPDFPETLKRTVVLTGDAPLKLIVDMGQTD